MLSKFLCDVVDILGESFLRLLFVRYVLGFFAFESRYVLDLVFVFLYDIVCCVVEV